MGIVRIVWLCLRSFSKLGKERWDVERSTEKIEWRTWKEVVTTRFYFSQWGQEGRKRMFRESRWRSVLWVWPEDLCSLYLHRIFLLKYFSNRKEEERSKKDGSAEHDSNKNRYLPFDGSWMRWKGYGSQFTRDFVRKENVKKFRVKMTNLVKQCTETLWCALGFLWMLYTNHNNNIPRFRRIKRTIKINLGFWWI